MWHGRSWSRKAIEALWTPLTEAVWSKRRIVEIYLNVAEFDEGVFGVQAAARHYFGVDAANLSPTQAARFGGDPAAPKDPLGQQPQHIHTQSHRCDHERGRNDCGGRARGML